MSSVFIQNIIGTGTYAVPTTDAELAAASSGLSTILSGVAGLSAGNISAWITAGSGAITRQLNCVLSNVTWGGELCPDTTETAAMIAAIQAALIADPNITSVNLQAINIENVPTGPAVPTTHKTSHQSGGSDEISVAGLSGLLSTAQTPAAHKTSHQSGGGDEISVAGLSGLLSTAQTPAAHKTSHQSGGGDEISVAGLSGLLSTAQTPAAHKTSHQSGGGDEISVAGLSGVLTDGQMKTLSFFDANQATYPASNPASAGSRNAHPVINFDDTTSEQIIFHGFMPQDYNNGNFSVYVVWCAASATSNSVIWDAAFERIQAGTTDIDSDSFAADQSVTQAAPGTSGVTALATIAFTQVQADSIAKGESFRLRIQRDTTDTLVGDAQLLRVIIGQ